MTTPNNNQPPVNPPPSPPPLSNAQPPPNWPVNVTYRPVPLWSPSAPAPLRTATLRSTFLPHNRSDEPVVHELTTRIPNPVLVQKITDPRHPCVQGGGSGLFASVELESRKLILDYVGVVFQDDGEDRRAHEKSDYVLRFTDVLSVDAELCGNEARFVNDFRGIADKPNCEFRNYWAHDRPVPGQQELRIGVWTVKDIAKGEELLVSYGKSYWNSRGGIRNKWTEANTLVEEEWEKRAAAIAQSMGCEPSKEPMEEEDEIAPASIYEPTKEEMRKMRRYR